MQCGEPLAVLISTYRTTPDERGISPAEKLHGRQHRTLLSAMIPEPTKQKPRPKVKFSVVEPVFVRQFLRNPKWTAAVVKKNLGKRMYLVETETGICRRHQNQIRHRLPADDRTEDDTGHAFMTLAQVSGNESSSESKEAAPNPQRTNLALRTST